MLHRVAPAHGLLNGVKTLLAKNEPCFATIRIGVVECRASATHRRNFWCSALHLQRTAQIEPVVCLPAIKVATGCTAQCIKQVFANQPISQHVDDGLHLSNAWVTAAVKCAPPANAPTPDERVTCRPFLEREFAALDNAHVLVCLGAFAYQAATEFLHIRPRPKFGHGVEVQHGKWTLLCSFHPSQQNTFTGKLTEPMFDNIFERARELCAIGAQE